MFDTDSVESSGALMYTDRVSCRNTFQENDQNFSQQVLKVLLVIFQFEVSQTVRPEV